MASEFVIKLRSFFYFAAAHALISSIQLHITLVVAAGRIDLRHIKTKEAMKHNLFIVCTLVIMAATAGCSKSKSKPGTDTGDIGTHYINPQLVGTWLWTEGSDGAYYNDDGVYQGAAYGLATRYKINADGSGTCFNSTLGGSFEVNISSRGFFESDDQGHLGYFPLSGTYKTSEGTNRSLRPDELYDLKTGQGKVTLYQKVVVTEQGGRTCFQVTSGDDITDTFFKTN